MTTATHKVWKTWKADGTANTVHHTQVVNAAADAWGRNAADMVSQAMNRARRDGERVTAVQANMAMEHAAAVWGA